MHICIYIYINTLHAGTGMSRSTKLKARARAYGVSRAQLPTHNYQHNPWHVTKTSRTRTYTHIGPSINSTTQKACLGSYELEKNHTLLWTPCVLLLKGGSSWHASSVCTFSGNCKRDYLYRAFYLSINRIFETFTGFASQLPTCKTTMCLASQ